MLTQKCKYSSGDIISVKVVNGDELVAKFVRETDSGYVVTRPMAVVLAPQGIKLVHALFTVDTSPEMTIKHSVIMMDGPTTDQVVNHYLEVTTGIKPVTKGSIITA